jgi:hypothetical protein
VIYRIDDQCRRVYVVAIEHCSEYLPALSATCRRRTSTALLDGM